MDPFRCESILLNSHWVLVVMDQFTRRIIGFGVHAGDLERKLEAFCKYYNAHRVHTLLDGNTLSEINDETIIRHVTINQLQWKSHCRKLYKLPATA